MFLLVRALVLDLALVLVVAVVVTVVVAVVVGVLVTLVVGVVIAVADGTSHDVAGLLVLQIRMYGLAKTGFQSLKISSGA